MEKGVRGEGTSRFIKNDFGKIPELKVSKIMEKYRYLGKSLVKKKKEKKKVTPRALHWRAKNHIIFIIHEKRFRKIKGFYNIEKSEWLL